MIFFIVRSTCATGSLEEPEGRELAETYVCDSSELLVLVEVEILLLIKSKLGWAYWISGIYGEADSPKSHWVKWPALVVTFYTKQKPVKPWFWVQDYSMAVLCTATQNETWTPDRVDPMIMKVLLLGWTLSMALQVCQSLQFPQMQETRLHNSREKLKQDP